MRAFNVVSLGAFYVARPMLRVWYRQRVSRRVRVAVRHGDKLLLVKTSFSTQHDYMPGGGIERGEQPVAAAIRELREETGIKLSADRLTYLGDLKTSQAEIPFHISLFECVVENEELPPLTPYRRLEIIQRRWFRLDDIPVHDPVIAWYLNRDQFC